MADAITTTTTSSYDYSTIGAIGSEATQSLNGEMINKIRAAEEKAVLDPLTEQLEDIDLEAEKMAEIQEKLNIFLEVVKPFDLYNSGTSAFDQIGASTTGDSVIFDAADPGSLENGVTTVNVEKLAQRDAYQTYTFTDKTDKISTTAGDTLTIQVGTDGEVFEFDLENLSYEDLVKNINYKEGLDASIEEVGDGDFRVIIKSSEYGEDNTLTIENFNDSDPAVTIDSLGLLNETDPETGTSNHILTAQNSKMTVDGVLYQTSSNTITVNGNLAITATKIGDASLSVQKDYSGLYDSFEAMAETYNDIIDTINEELYSAESKISDKSGLRSILNSVKELFFQKYGAETPEFGTQEDEYGIVYAHSNVTNNDKSLFSYGFSFDTDGHMVIDEDELNDAISNSPEDLEALFRGSPENEGLATQLKTLLDGLDGHNGLMTLYTDNMDERKVSLEEEKEDTIKELDTKYDLMAAQFVEYGAMITKMEASFSGLKMMIEQANNG